MIIVFDLDGTLIDSARDLAESVGELLESYGATPLPLNDVVNMVGEGAPILVRRAMERSGIEPDARDALALRGFFSRIIGGDSNHGRKPNPDGLLSLQALAPGKRLVMVGDSPADYMAAVNAGCVFVFARFGFGARKFDAAPDTPYVIDHPRELDAVLSLVSL